MAYSEKVIDHYENPRNVGSFDNSDENVGSGMVGAPACGDVMKLQIKVNNEGIIEDARFKTYGCGSAIASSSLATEWMKGSLEDIDAARVPAPSSPTSTTGRCCMAYSSTTVSARARSGSAKMPMKPTTTIGRITT